ncbi:Peptidase A24A, prepilin type IV [Pseudomonas syringae pv. helianthi]|uniref:Peptidase A24A, prepilin type IV n=1 Tax=Pseudomonas syringae pv. helianthi TaxID=251654 RepID=A0A0P9RF31_9PSED|nr:Peptidase A24A, prepilin type IV [Pseudomonas syringae pv. helianthi]RMV44262.1 Peptidase A24A, prepilin type IV [Pseudomonas syringae pv. helianthi]
MVKLFFLLVWFAICAEQDARHKQISNWLTLGAATLAAVYLSCTGTTWLGAAPSEAALALALALGLTLPGYALGKLGAGDVKLMAALALASNSVYLLCTFMGAGIAMLIGALFLKSGRAHRNQGGAQRDFPGTSDTPDKYPFSPFLLAGLLITVCFVH